MIFSSVIFLFVFLPLVLFVYFVILRKHRRAQNIFLCIASLFFYAWGEPKFVFVLILSIIVNWIFGLLVSNNLKNKKVSKVYVALDIIFNLVVIFIFKYLAFSISNINILAEKSLISVPSIVLPIGISFFTFQAISYVVDIYRRRAKAQKSLLNVGLYISFFPALIAGPIVRYETIADQIENRKENWDDFSQGCNRFIVGLGKKVLLSNSMAIVADAAFLTNTNSAAMPDDGTVLSVSMAWLGALAYTLQIYFDFSGYSDMAIGLGKMFGFHLLENFNYPYISKSATEFWRRWHISLGSWFRDYVYIPLGGSHVKSKFRHIFNLFVVWLCTGIWHGANWTFIAWGLMYFILIVLEKFTGFEKISTKFNFFKHIYLLLFVVIGWVIFRAENLNLAVDYLQTMFGLGETSLLDSMFIEYLRQYAVFFLFAILFSFPVVPALKQYIKDNLIIQTTYSACVILAFIISISFIVKGSYNPFIYFNF